MSGIGRRVSGWAIKLVEAVSYMPLKVSRYCTL